MSEPAAGRAPRPAGAGLVGIAAILALVLLAAVLGGFGTLGVLVAIIALIVAHEVGHFVAAKRFGLKVSEFFVGFGPRIWSVRRGETEYGLRMLPVGGYVRIAGMNNLDPVDPPDEARTYRQAPFWKRVTVSAAGPLVHFVLAVALLWTLLAVVGTPYPTGRIEISGFPSLAGVANPARAAGLRKGDVITAVDGRPLSAANAQVLSTALRSHAGVPVRLAVLRGGRRLSYSVVPVNARAHPEQGAPRLQASGPAVGVIGVRLGEATVQRREGPLAAAVGSLRGVGQISWLSMQTLAQRFSPHGISSYVSQLGGHHPPGSSASSARLESPIGIGRLASQAASAGPGAVITLLVEINVFLGLFNLVPLLPLDGGHVAVAAYERLRTRKGRPYHADVAKLLPAAYAVILVLVVLGITAAYLDITQPLPNPFQ